MKKKLSLLLPAAAVLFGGAFAQGAALVNYQILGNTDGSSNYTNSLNVQSGDVVNFEVIASMANLGTTNGTKTINSLALGTDGIVTSAFNLVDTSAASIAGTFSQANLVANARGTSFSSGTVGTNALNGIKIAVDTTSGNPPFGVVSNNTPGFQLLLTGTFTVGSGASGTSTIGETFASAGSFKINGGSSTFVSSAANDASFNNFSALTLTAGDITAVPAPSVLGTSAFTAALVGIVRFRRRFFKIA